MSTSSMSLPLGATHPAITPRKRRMRSLLNVLYRGLESMGRFRAARVIEETAADLQFSRPQLARELRAASARLLSY